MHKLLVIFCFAGMLLGACNQEERFTTDANSRLEFSTDTLRFDTVFTELSSATRFFKVYNRHQESIKISRIALAGNHQSKFNLNVDGLTGNEHHDVVIYPEDSIYVFCEVTINPDDPLSVSPFFVYDSVIFETNGNLQTVVLEAFGQNANYIPSRWHKDSIVLYGCNGAEVIWDDPRPYVVYGIVAFDDCTLTLPPGCRVYVHGGLSKTEIDMETVIYNSGRLYFGPQGRLNVQGTLENPVVIQGDRLEAEFQEEPGQWTGIIFAAGSKGNHIQYAEIKNSLFGIYVDSAAELTLQNVKVYNTSGPGLFALHAKVNAENCLWYNNGSYCVQIGYGGTYQFTYCTLANFGTPTPALGFSNGICDDPLCSTPPRIFPLDIRLVNSIVYGSKRDEIAITDFTGGQNPFALAFSFEHCIVRVNDLLNPDAGFPDFFDHCDPCINATTSDALFANSSEDDYHLDTLSIAEGKAIPIPTIPTDLDGKNRDSQAPDIGCFEYYPE